MLAGQFMAGKLLIGKGVTRVKLGSRGCYSTFITQSKAILQYANFQHIWAMLAGGRKDG